MKVLIAVHHFPPTFGGGAEWRAYRTAHGLREAGHQVDVVCVESVAYGTQGIKPTQTTCDGVTVHRLDLTLPKADAFAWQYRNPLTGSYVAELLAQTHPNVLHLISGYLLSGSVLEAARVAKVPTVLTLTDFWFLCPRITLVRSDGLLCTTPADPLACALCLRKERRRYRWLDQVSGGAVGNALSWIWENTDDTFWKAIEERKSYLLSTLNRVDVVISPSRFLQEFFEAQGLSLSRFLHMRQGLDMASWERAEPIRCDSCLRIGYIGQIAKHKGVDVLIEAFRLLQAGTRRPVLTLYGDPGQFPQFSRQLRRQTAKLQDVTFAGRFEHSKIRQVHAQIDVLVVPSVWYENSPNVILEAFANQTPAVVSRLGGMAELVTDGVNGYQFGVGDAEDLARVLQRFLDQPDLVGYLRQRMPPVKSVQEEIGELVEVYASLKGESIV